MVKTNADGVNKKGKAGPRRGRSAGRRNSKKNSVSSMVSAKSPTQPTVTDREQALLDNKFDLRPLDNPLFPYESVSKIRPQQYLSSSTRVPLGKKVADWTKEFFQLSKQPNYRTTSYTESIRPKAPTVISLFYYDETSKRPLDTYLARLQNLADMGEQTIVYVPPVLTERVKAMRNDIHWCVVDDYETVWDFPNNKYQRNNFTNMQPAIFSRFEGAIAPWQLAYNRPFLSAVYNAKAFCTYDAVMRNPFGSETWMYIDAGLFDAGGPRDDDGVAWGDLKFREHLDDKKIARAISLSRDTGVIVGEHIKNPLLATRDINHPCWTDPKKAWMAHRFAAGCYVGSSLGMLNYSVRFMQTVDDLDANNRYSGREEFVIAFLAARYPNTIFSIPFEQPNAKADERNTIINYPFCSCYTTQGGPETVPMIVDPLSTTYYKDYVPRQPNLEATGNPKYVRFAAYK